MNAGVLPLPQFTNQPPSVNDEVVDTRFTCDQCGRHFPFRPNLITHIRRSHKDQLEHCTYPNCDKKYQHRWDLTNHIDVIHLGKKILCPHCSASFSKKSNLHNHLKRGKGCPRAPPNNEYDRSPSTSSSSEQSYPGAAEQLEDMEGDEREEQDKEGDDGEQGEEMPDTNDDLEPEVKLEAEDENEENQTHLYRLLVENMRLARLMASRNQSRDSQSLGDQRYLATQNSATLGFSGSVSVSTLNQISGTDQIYDTQSGASRPELKSITAKHSEMPRTLGLDLNPNHENDSGNSDLNSLELLAEVALNQVSTNDAQIDNQEINSQRQTNILIKSNGLINSIPSLLSPVTCCSTMIPVNLSVQASPWLSLSVQADLSSQGDLPTQANPPVNQPVQANRDSDHGERIIPGLHILPGIISGRFIRSGVSKPSGVHLNMLGLINQNETRPDLNLAMRVENNLELAINNPGPSSRPNFNQHFNPASKPKVGSPESDPLITSSQEELFCQICGRIASKISSLNNHMRTMHGEEGEERERKFECSTCQKLFFRKSNLTEHVRRVHQNEVREYKRTYCEHCGKGFARQTSCNQHKTRCLAKRSKNT